MPAAAAEDATVLEGAGEETLAGAARLGRLPEVHDAPGDPLGRETGSASGGRPPGPAGGARTRA